MTQEKENEKPDGREIDLMKVQIYADRCHAMFTSLLSFVFAYLIGLVVLFYTVFYQNLPYSLVVWEVGVPSTLGSSFIFLWIVLRVYLKDFKVISEMIEKVEERKRLPKLAEFAKRRKSS